MISYEYRNFLNEKILDYLPAKRWKVNDKWNFKCPICGDGKSGKKHRAWWYNGSSSFFCFNCSTGMSGIKFLELMSGSDYETIKREYLKLFIKSNKPLSLSAEYDIPENEPKIFKLKPIVQSEWKKPLSDSAKNYLDSRLLTLSPFYDGKLYSWNSKNRNEYILIPWTVNGIDAYYQLNDFLKHGQMKYIFPKDHKKLVYGLDNIDIAWNKIIVFEGVYDSMFVKNGVASGTKSITDYQVLLIKERFPKHEIVISFDNDESGIQSMMKLIKKDNDFKYFRWFNDNTLQKDINDYVKAKSDPCLFNDLKKLDRMIVDKLVMKMWLIRNGYWK